MADMTLKELRDQIAPLEGEDPRRKAWVAILDAHLAGMGEPVAWQYRILDDEEGPSPYWHDMTRAQFEMFSEAAKPRYELRQLYTAPPASGDWDKVREVAEEMGKDGGRLHDEWMHRLTAALPEKGNG